MNTQRRVGLQVLTSVLLFIPVLPIHAGPAWGGSDGLVIKRVVDRPSETKLVPLRAGAQQLAPPTARGFLGEDQRLILRVGPAPKDFRALNKFQQPEVAWFKSPRANAGGFKSLGNVGASDTSPAAAWNEAHAYLDESVEAAERGELLSVEPDYLVTEPADWEDRRHAPVVAKAAQPTLWAIGGPNSDWPTGPMAWHLGADFSQLRAAAARIDPTKVTPAYVAVLDIGFLINHEAFPEKRDPPIEIADADRDPSHGLPGQPWFPNPSWFNGPEHGTSTSTVLAGKPAELVAIDGSRVPFSGGNPHARVLPIRIGGSVVAAGLFRTFTRLSDMTAGFNTAIDRHVDVISMSVGGFPSGSLADAVERAHGAGIPMFCATGDYKSVSNMKLTSPKYVVFPAAYRPVMAVAGVTSQGSSYGVRWAQADPSHSITFGSFGPADKMSNAISGWTPNVPWIRFPDGQGPANDPWAISGAWNLMDLDGGGTSAATPQAAATASLIIEKYRDALKQTYHECWQRTEAVYCMIRKGAKPPPKDADGNPDVEHFGAGFLRADDALNQPLPKLSELPSEAPEAEASFLYILELILSSLGGPESFATLPRVPATHRTLAASVLQRLDQQKASPRVRGVGYYAAEASMFETELEQLLAEVPKLARPLHEALATRSVEKGRQFVGALLSTRATSRKTTELLQAVRDAK